MRSCTPPHMRTGKKIIQNAVKLGIRVTSRIGRGCKASGRGSQAPADLKMRLLAWSTWLTSEAFSIWALTLPSSLREPHHLSSRVASKKECKQTSPWVTVTELGTSGSTLRGPFPSRVSWETLKCSVPTHQSDSLPLCWESGFAKFQRTCRGQGWRWGLGMGLNKVRL